MNKSESIKELATALCKFQGSVEKIKKTATNPFFKSKYANLADILDVIREPLSESGLSFVQFPKGEHELDTMLMHVSGEWISETYKMAPTKNDPQGLGSAITYQRRYALGSILGLNIDDDDDGNKASEPIKKAIQTPTIQQPINQLSKVLDKQLTQAILTLETVAEAEKVKAIWDSMPELHTNKLFIKSVTDAKKRLMPKTN